MTAQQLITFAVDGSSSKISVLPTVSSGTVNVPSARLSRQIDEQTLGDAIYAHIQAIRSLGETRTNSARIAAALGLRKSQVEKAIRSMRSKGVRVLND